MSVAGAIFVVVGGLVAAGTRPLALAEGSWLAAYLVLVCGVAQYGMGRAPTVLGSRPVSFRTGWTLLAAWNLGNAAVVVGTVGDVPVMVDAGGALLAVGLVLAWRLVPRPGMAGRNRPRQVADWGYRGLLLVLLVSIPVGLVLAHMR